MLKQPLSEKVAALDAIGKQTLVEHAVVDGRAVTLILSVDGAAGDLFRLGVRLLRKISELQGQAELDASALPKIDPNLN